MDEKRETVETCRSEVEKIETDNRNSRSERRVCMVDDCDGTRAWVLGKIVVCEYHRKNLNDFVIYRHFNSEGQLLYVGVTNNVQRRLAQHIKNENWFWEVLDGGYTEYDRFSNREDLLCAEKRAIQSERPRYNVAHQQVG